MNLAKNIIAMVLVTGSLWGCSLSEKKKTGKWLELAGSQRQVQSIDGRLVLATVEGIKINTVPSV
ncbi:hypothetical protein [Marinobacter halophilus]|uniref:Uncharacterized protein n=1 Tax=Marinobacter halophilus TaxID=1323740 RepID=A0A2T1KF68_9GAMM|nr:hypothetical protein [Marinobacter halophilus]PSF08771.1 hypothetical protein C7H08_08895 [Marinobacter halophilus]GGC63668.1 hypothetical protein GCM10011362_10040 [Marinobacter halophilus]